jgi:hypothetical protein
MHDPRVGRFFSEDPLTPRYPHYSPYIFSGNNPILFLDLEGLEEKLPWYLGPCKYGGKPVLTLGLHNLEAIYYNRKEYLVGAPPTYQGQAILGIFVMNSAGSAWNNLASTWNNALAGQDAGQMYEEGTSNLGKLVRRIENDGFKKTFSDPEVVENITGGLITIYATRKISNLKLPGRIQSLVRKELATNFYKKAGFDLIEIPKHIKGIDLNSPVLTKTFKAGTLLEQWTYIDRTTGQPKIGNYYTLPGSDPTKLGIPLEGRVKTTLMILEDTKFLQSTTKSIQDWTTPGRTLDGGGTQLFQTNVKTKIVNQ